MKTFIKIILVILVSSVVVILAQHYFGNAKLPMRPPMGGEQTVSTENVKVRLFSDRIEAIGTTAAKESVTITSNVTKKIANIHFEDGAMVKVGDVLVTLENAEESAQVEEGKVELVKEKREFERFKSMREKKVLSEKEYDNQRSAMESAEARLATAQAKLRDLIIVSPFDGVLGIRHVSRGTLLNPGTLITTLDDLSAVKLDFAVPETFLASLKPGQDIEAHSVAWPGETFKGTVSCIDSRVDANTRAVTVQAVIPNPENRLRPGMLLTVKLFSNQRNSACVPEKALVAYGEHQYVYILRKDSTVEKREVKLGQRDSGQVEITAGLNKNECIVVEGTTDLRDGAKVLMSDGGKTDVGGNNRPRTSSPEK